MGRRTGHNKIKISESLGGGRVWSLCLFVVTHSVQPRLVRNT